VTTGQKIRKLRRERDWTQAELGEKAGINFRNLNRYEHDRFKPGVRVLGRLADAFGVSVDDLLGEEPRTTEPPPLEDADLLYCFQQVEQMNEDDQAAIKRLLQAMIIKNQVQNLGKRAS
jgi:transcriptional regulator with XRE-family HTH domain